MSKSVLSDAASDQKRSFTFQVQLYADDTYAEGHELKLSGRYGAMVFDENGAAEVNLTGGDSATAEGLPAGVHYRITEASADGFDLKSITTTVGNNEPSTADSNALNARAAQGTTASDDTKVEFANERKLGFMGIMKTLDSDAASDQNKVFVFTVRLSDQSITKDYEPVVKNDPDHVDISFVNGEATVRLTKDQRASADSLPTGLGYTVVEEDAADYNDEMSVSRAMRPVTPKGTMSETEMVNAFSTSGRANNVRRVGGLVVSKRLFNARPEDYDQEFDFKVTVNGLNTADPNALKHAITYYDKDDNETGSGTITFDQNGVTYIKLKGDTKANIHTLPIDVTYTVEEGDWTQGAFVATHEGGYVKDGLFKLTGKVGDAGIINTADSTATFSNSLITTGNLSLTKLLQTMHPADENAVFRFVITLNDSELGTADKPKAYPVMVEGDQQLSFVEGVATVDLKADNNWTASAVGLPTGTLYTVEEVGRVVNGQVVDATPAYQQPTYTYEVSKTAEDSEHLPVADDDHFITKDETVYVTVTNTRVPATISVTKVWNDTVDNTENKFGLRPKQIEAYLLKNGKRLADGETIWVKGDEGDLATYRDTYSNFVTLNAQNGWTVNNIVVPAYDENGQKVDPDAVYSWDEVEVDKYSSSQAKVQQEGESNTSTTTICVRNR